GCGKGGDPYGDTKIDAEEVLGEFSKRGELDVTMIRATVIYGPGDDKFLPRIIDNLKTGKARIIGSGENTVDLIHVEDVADFVALLLKNETTIDKIYNLTNPCNPTWKELLTGIALELGFDPPTKHLPYRLALVAAGVMEVASKVTGKPPRLTRYAVKVVGRQYFYDTDRMENELGYRPKIDLMEGIKACLEL
ncbi:NAD-dependent epimerase/dehydratase family protein, partial [Thermodesulfobacteriota bacterium]